MSRDYNKCQRQVHVQGRVVCNVKICYWLLNFAWANGEERSTPACNERYFVVLRETTLNTCLLKSTAESCMCMYVLKRRVSSV